MRLHFRLATLISLVTLTSIPMAAVDAPLKVAVTPWIGDLGAAVAAEQGLWKKQGIEVQLVNYQGDEDFRAAIRGGVVDFCFDMTAMSVEMIRGNTDLVLYGETDWSNGGDKIVVKGVTAKDLIGGKVGIYDEGSAVNMVLDTWLKREGVDPAKVERQFLETGQLTDAFIAGKLKAILNYDPQAGRAVKDGGGQVAATTADFPGIMPEGIAGKRGIAPERLQKFFTGLLQGVAFMKDPANASAVAAAANAQLFSAEPQKPEEIAEQMASVKFHGPKEILERNSQGEAGLNAFVEQVQVWSLAHGQAKVDMSDHIDTTALVAAAKALAGK